MLSPGRTGIRGTRRLTPTLGVVVVALVGGCHPRPGPADAPALAPPAPVLAYVKNFNRHDVRVLAVRGTIRHRLGLVTGMSQRTFLVPRYLYAGIGYVRLAVEPIGTSDAWMTEEIRVRPGSRIRWDVNDVLAHSRVMMN